MSEFKVLIKCENCSEEFDSPISFGRIEDFDETTLIGNTVDCPHCESPVSCNKENVRTTHGTDKSDGGFVGNQIHKP